MILSSLVHTDFQPYLLLNTDAWALPEDKALELLVYLEQQGVRQIHCVPPVKVENGGNAFSFLKDAFHSCHLPVGLYPCSDATGTFTLLGNGRLSALAGIGMQADAESIFLVRLQW